MTYAILFVLGWHSNYGGMGLTSLEFESMAQCEQVERKLAEQGDSKLKARTRCIEVTDDER